MNKRIYFVRHGESTANQSGIFQGFDSLLTDKGINQGHLVGKRLSKLKIDNLISSTAPRAIQTAKIISEYIDVKNVIESNLLIERKNPSFFLGRDKKDPELIKDINLIIENIDNPNWHLSDEENMFDLKHRAEQALDFLINQEGENLVVVTHGWFLRVLIAQMCFGDNVSGKQLFDLFKTLRTYNTGITVVDHDSSFDYQPPWALISWNDVAHITNL